MAHELFQNDDQSYAIGSRLECWHGLENRRMDAKTMQELAEAAGLHTWQYSLEPIFFPVETLDDTWHHQVEGKRAVVKSGAPPVALSVVGDDYEYVQPMETVAQLDELIALADGKWIPETAMALGRGETTAFCVNVGSWSMAGNDKVEDYLLVNDTVDGRTSRQISIVNVRTVCRNTLRLALRKAVVTVNLTHGRTHRSSSEAVMKSIATQQDKLREALTKLSLIQYNEQKFARYINELFEKPDADSRDHIGAVRYDGLVRRAENMREQSHANMVKMTKEEGLPFTAWVAFNAASETIEHSPFFGGDKGVKKSLLLGKGPAYEMVSRAFEYVQ